MVYSRTRNRRSLRARVAALLLLLVASTVLLTAPLTAASVPLSGSMPLSGDVNRFDISPDSQYVIYEADQEQETDDAFHLYSVPLNSSAAPVRLSGLLPKDSDISGNEIAPDSSRVVYRAPQDTLGVEELYSVPIDGSAPPQKLNSPLVADGDVSNFEISPDSSRVVYRAPQDTLGVEELYSVPIDGSAPPQKLNSPLVAGGVVSSFFHISPDSSHVVYGADQDTDQVQELYSVLIDGSAPPQKLNSPLVAGGDVSLSFRISPDSNRVVYRADQDTFGVSELYSVPIDGSAPPQKLNSPLVAGGDVSLSFRISLDNNRVVYRADQDTDQEFELYSVPIDGSAPPQKLNSPLVAGGEVSFSFGISVDSSRVVYLADQDTDDVDELYSVPIDGSAAPQKLNSPLVAGGDVLDFRISPESSRVVYFADQDTDDVDELYSVPIDGSAPPQKLNSPLVAGGVVSSFFRISPDSSHVVYRADQDTDDVEELYSVPIDGSAPPQKLNSPLVAGGEVLSFRVSADSRRVVYRADQDTDDVEELYAVDLDNEEVVYLPLVHSDE
jgi:hypothetical protein